MADNKFYLGRIFDPQLGETTPDRLHYDPDDLTTHAFVVGMTGSGKTGLCIDLLEEAALNNIPALMIDPKGDITNSLLHFPNLAPEDFEPWVNPDEARRAGKTVQQAAVDTAALWKKGLAQWDIGPERIQQLQESAEFTVYTPGSDAGVPVSILATLKAPELDWDVNAEIIRERIGSTVTALLGLVGLRDIDPLQSREHILMSNIFETAWRAGKDLNLAELIMQVQNPPFEKLGVFDVAMFFPDKDRFSLAMSLNNILAAPAFQNWINGVPLDIPKLMYTPEGKPRHSVFYIAHLNDEERMFFVTLLFGAVETWMRTQSGTNTLRSLVYFDEIFGYLPAGMSNPPSKEPMLRMLKQARAFGVGLVLATQNPVDVDYKAMSNAGTWFIGKLQTDRDKERLLDGLAGSGKMSRGQYDDLISKLGKRVFLLHNVHEKAPALFQTRWAMNYLAGPLTRAQIPALNALWGGTTGIAATDTPNIEAQSAPAASTDTRSIAADVPAARPRVVPPAGTPIPTRQTAPEPDLPGLASRPAVPGTHGEFFLPHNLTLMQAARADRRELAPDAQELTLLYRPELIAQADVRYMQSKYNLNLEEQYAYLVVEPDGRGRVRWEEYETSPFDVRDMDPTPIPNARFAGLEGSMSDTRWLTSTKREFKDWIYRNKEAIVRGNEALKVYAGVNIPQREFLDMMSKTIQQEIEEETDKLDAKFERTAKSLDTKLDKEVRELELDKEEYEQRKMEEYGTHAENLFKLFSKRRSSRITTSLSKRRMTAKAKADIAESEAEIKRLERELENLETEWAQARAEIETRWKDTLENVTEIPVRPYKKDIVVELFGVAWRPYYVVESDGRTYEIPAFGREG
jgi:hypothetical protein